MILSLKFPSSWGCSAGSGGGTAADMLTWVEITKNYAISCQFCLSPLSSSMVPASTCCYCNYLHVEGEGHYTKKCCKKREKIPLLGLNHNFSSRCKVNSLTIPFVLTHGLCIVKEYPWRWDSLLGYMWMPNWIHESKELFIQLLSCCTFVKPLCHFISPW